MTSTAAATRTLRAPRRRTLGPAAGERVAAEIVAELALPVGEAP